MAASARVRVNRVMNGPRGDVRTVNVRRRNHSLISEIAMRVTSVTEVLELHIELERRDPHKSSVYGIVIGKVAARNR
jgi:hypothetical protein